MHKTITQNSPSFASSKFLRPEINFMKPSAQFPATSLTPNNLGQNSNERYTKKFIPFQPKPLNFFPARSRTRKLILTSSQITPKVVRQSKSPIHKKVSPKKATNPE